QSPPLTHSRPEGHVPICPSVEKKEASRNPMVGAQTNIPSGPGFPAREWSATQPLHGLPFLERLDHNHRDSAKVRRILDELRYRELGRPPVISNHRDGDRLRLVILTEGAVTPTLEARYRADPVTFHVPQPIRTGRLLTAHDDGSGLEPPAKRSLVKKWPPVAESPRVPHPVC